MTQKLSLLELATESDESKLLREWYFGFCHNVAELPRLQRWFVRNHPFRMRHAYAFAQVGDCVLFVEPFSSRIDFNVRWPTAEHPVLSAELMAEELVDSGHTVVRHIFTPNIQSVKSLWNCIPTCVTVVKNATGFMSSALSPLGLYEDLIKAGAKKITKEANLEGTIRT